MAQMKLVDTRPPILDLENHVSSFVFILRAMIRYVVFFFLNFKKNFILIGG